MTRRPTGWRSNTMAGSSWSGSPTRARTRTTSSWRATATARKGDSTMFHRFVGSWSDGRRAWPRAAFLAAGALVALGLAARPLPARAGASAPRPVPRAAAGDLDPSFGNAGLVTMNPFDDGVGGEGRAVAVQPDGKIVVAGNPVFDLGGG